MATKTRLEKAVEQQVSKLNDAQKELALSQLGIYKQNSARIADIDAKLDAINATSAPTMDSFRYKQSQRTTLAYERSQLAMANSKIASDLFDFLEDK